MVHRRLATAALVAALAFVPVACGSSGGSDSSSSDRTTAAPSSSDDTTAPADDRADTTDGSDQGDGGSGENPGTEKLVDGPAEADKTVTFTDGAWDPTSLEVKPGEVFSFQAGDGAGTVAVTFNGQDSYTLSGGLTESFTLDTPGTYTVSEYLSGTEMTVTVTE